MTPCCRYGHAYTHANTRYTNTGARVCKQCRRNFEDNRKRARGTGPNLDPERTFQDRRWMDGAACQNLPPAAFVPDQDDDDHRTIDSQTKPAQKVCGNCDVIQQCALYALAQGHPFGLWAGVAFSESLTGESRYRRIQRLRAVAYGRPA